MQLLDRVDQSMWSSLMKFLASRHAIKVEDYRERRRTKQYSDNADLRSVKLLWKNRQSLEEYLSNNWKNKEDMGSTRKKIPL